MSLKEYPLPEKGKWITVGNNVCVAYVLPREIILRLKAGEEVSKREMQVAALESYTLSRSKAFELIGPGVFADRSASDALDHKACNS